jgi:hypothetical protein
MPFLVLSEKAMPHSTSLVKYAELKSVGDGQMSRYFQLAISQDAWMYARNALEGIH